MLASVLREVDRVTAQPDGQIVLSASLPHPEGGAQTDGGALARIEAAMGGSTTALIRDEEVPWAGFAVSRTASSK